MSRTAVYTALALQVRSFGESNREAVFLTAEEGLLRATVFGGPKSKLRSYAAPYHGGKIWIYRDPVRDSRKLTDFDVLSWRPGIRESYGKLMAAGALAETILASHGGGGSWTEALDLANGTLDALDAGTENTILGTILRFLLLWAELLGAVPELDRCCRCACTPREDEVLYYSRIEGALVCAECAAPLLRSAAEDLISLGPGARRWISAAARLSAAEALRYGMDGRSSSQVQSFATELLAGALGRKLPSWEGIQG